MAETSPAPYTDHRAGGVRATLGREGLFDAGISSGSEGPGSMGEEAQILKLE